MKEISKSFFTGLGFFILFIGVFILGSIILFALFMSIDGTAPFWLKISGALCFVFACLLVGKDF